MPKEVDVIILSCLRIEKTFDCVKSLFGASDSHLFNIIIVDNGSGKDIRADLHRLNNMYNNDMTIVFNNKNRGVGQGRKQGAGYGNAPYIIFLDNDMVVAPGYVEALLIDIKQEDDIAAVCSKVIENDKVRLSGRMIRNGRIDYSNDNLPMGDPRTEKFKYCDVMHGGATIYRRKAYDEVEFDHHYFLCYGDLDMMMQFRQKKWKLAYCPEATAYHFPAFSGEYARLRRNSRYILTAKEYFERKWGIKT